MRGRGVSRQGFEPWTLGLKVRCSDQTELPALSTASGSREAGERRPTTSGFGVSELAGRLRAKTRYRSRGRPDTILSPARQEARWCRRCVVIAGRGQPSRNQVVQVGGAVYVQQGYPSPEVLWLSSAEYSPWPRFLRDRHLAAYPACAIQSRFRFSLQSFSSSTSRGAQGAP